MKWQSIGVSALFGQKEMDSQVREVWTQFWACKLTSSVEVLGPLLGRSRWAPQLGRYTFHQWRCFAQYGQIVESPFWRLTALVGQMVVRFPNLYFGRWLSSQLGNLNRQMATAGVGAAKGCWHIKANPGIKGRCPVLSCIQRNWNAHQLAKNERLIKEPDYLFVFQSGGQSVL